jgi:transposase
MSRQVSKQQQIRNLIKLLYDHGIKDVDLLAQVSNGSKRTVQRVIKAINSNQTIERKPGGGRPPKLSKKHCDILSKLVKRNPRYSAARLGELAVDKGVPKVSRVTIWRHLKKMGYKIFTPQRIPMLTKRHKKSRLDWCEANKNTDWSKVCFTDESYFMVHRNVNRRWDKRRPKVPTPAHGPSFMVWGGISINGLTVLFVDRGSINAEWYTEILHQNLVESMKAYYGDDWVLQQDNARPHTAKFTRNWMSANGIKIMDWPACSPDLNPIEHVWAIMKNRLEVLNPKNSSAFMDAIKKVWAELWDDGELVKTLIESMPKRIAKCIKAKGGYFK